jgi:Ethanolamine utilization protein EutJ (predicted chaperonin)
MKAYRENRSIVTLILNLGTTWTSCLDSFTQLIVRMGGFTEGIEVLKKGKFLLYCNAHFSLSDEVRLGFSA